MRIRPRTKIIPPPFSNGAPSIENTINTSSFLFLFLFGNAPSPSVALQVFSTMHLKKLTLLVSLASAAFGLCVRNPGDCPSGTHAENEPMICRDEGYPPHYHLLCVGGDYARQECLDRWLPRGSSRQASLRKSMCGLRGDPCDISFDCCQGNCDFVAGECR